MRQKSCSSYRFSIPLVTFLISFLVAACGHKSVTVRPPAPPSPKVSAPPRREPPPGVPKPPPAATTTGAPPAAEHAKAPAPVAPSVKGPLIRIGLTVPGEEIRLSSAGEFYLVEKTPENPRRTLSGQVRVRVERPQSEPAEIFRVQVASLTNQEAAEKLGRQLSEKFSLPAVVHENAANGMNQVRVGRFAARKEAQDFAKGPAAEAGYGDAFVVREVGEAAKGEPTLAVRGPESLFQVSRAGFLFMPGAETEFLRLNGNPYRGVLDISLNGNGSIVVVNELPVEDYILGVVPAELSPTNYPEAAALEAQAIAARTYALKHMGQSRAKGFDISDDTSAQVYRGAIAEKDMSNDAVRKTAGIAIYYNGALIDAMYTSTCGGRTEDFSNVFDSAPVPYLKSVVCAVENAPVGSKEANLEGNHSLDQVIFADDGTPANREIELAQVLGLAAPGRISPEIFAGPPGADEVRSWIDKSLLVAGRSDTETARHTADITTRAGFIEFACERFFGSRELDRRVSETDVAYYLSNFSDGASVPVPARRAIAYLAQRKLWQPYPDNSIKPDLPIKRGDALTLLVRWILSARPEVLKTGTSAEPGADIASEDSRGTLAVKRGNRTERLRLAQDLHLFKSASGRSMPVAGLHMIGNEKLSFHQKPGGEIDFLEVELSASGAASDRFSPVATWQSTITRAVVAEKLKPLAGNIGEIRDLKPARFGNSGRVVRLEVIGSRGSVVVNGYRARNALGLRDTLYTLSRTLSDDGAVASFTFDGRGWGHGVGLCQTGAVGMARAGRSAEEILKTYYQGVELRRAY